MRKLAFLALPLLLAACGTATPTAEETTPLPPAAVETPSSNPLSTVDSKLLSPQKTVPLATLPVAENAGHTEQTRAPAAGDTVAHITTNHGEIWLRLLAQEAPKTVQNFVALSQKEYYNGLIFHRVIPGFMIQGGDPTGTGMGGASIFGEKFADEINPALQYLRGTLAMANSGPNTNGSQFFIVQAKNGYPLPPAYTIFGQAFAGLNTLDVIAAEKTDGGDKPLTPVTMSKVEVFLVK